MNPRRSTTVTRACVCTLLVAGLFGVWGVGAATAQDRLKSMPGYEQNQRMAKEMQGAVKSGALSATWKDDSKSFEYTKDGKLYRFDVATKPATEVGPAPAAAAPGGFGMRGGRRRPGPAGRRRPNRPTSR